MGIFIFIFVMYFSCGALFLVAWLGNVVSEQRHELGRHSHTNPKHPEPETAMLKILFLSLVLWPLFAGLILWLKETNLPTTN